MLPRVPIHDNVPTPPHVLLAAHGQQHSLSSSPAGSLKHSSTSSSTSSSNSLPIRNNLVKIEAALAKFDLLSDIVAIHR